jgi:hypothetical protein
MDPETLVITRLDICIQLNASVFKIVVKSSKNCIEEQSGWLPTSRVVGKNIIPLAFPVPISHRWRRSFKKKNAHNIGLCGIAYHRHAEMHGGIAPCRKRPCSRRQYRGIARVVATEGIAGDPRPAHFTRYRFKFPAGPISSGVSIAVRACAD